MFARKVLVAVACLIWFSAQALAEGDTFVQATQFEYAGGATSCAQRSGTGTSGPYVVASCAIGQSFIFHVANPTGGTLKPDLFWTSTSSSTNHVCWTLTAGTAPYFNGAPGTYGSGNYFNGPLSSMGSGQNNTYAVNETGGFQHVGATTMSDVDIYSNSDTPALCTAGFEILKCQLQEMWVKVARIACGSAELGANADIIQVHYFYTP